MYSPRRVVCGRSGAQSLADIFLSYNREDQAVAALYASAFAREGLSVWWDTELRAGEAYDEVTEAALRGAKAVVVLWSPRSVVSRWVRAEATIAERCRTLLPVMIEPCERPIMFELTQTAELSHWAGDIGDRAWQSFVGHLREFVSREVASTDRTPAASVPAAQPRPSETLLAVLPFDNLSSDAEMEFFSDGVSEDILARISRGSKLKVIGRTSSFQFRGGDKPKAAAALGASHVLDGSIRRAGSRVRIAAHLTETVSHTTLWSERFDRDLEDIFAVQDEISEAIATELQSTFFPDPQAKIDPVAYDLYLRARAIYLDDLTWADQAECRRLLAEAVALAPEFAPGWGLLGVYTGGAAAEAMAARGLAIDPQSAISMTAMAVSRPPFARHRKKYEWSSRAYALDPGDQMVAGIHNVILMSLGYMTEARELSEKRLEREPLSPMVASDLAIAYRASGMPEEAIEQSERALSDFPDAAYAKFIRGVIAVYDGDLDCLARMAAVPTSDGTPNPLMPLQMLMQGVGSMPPEMRRIAVGQFLIRSAPASAIVDIGLAAAMGEVELAMDHLLATLREGRPLLFSFENEGRAVIPAATCSGLFMPNCEELRCDPRFAEVCVRLGLYESWRESGHWPDCANELAPLYNFRAKCEDAAASVERYDPQR
jgi:TolB-like protein